MFAGLCITPRPTCRVSPYRSGIDKALPWRALILHVTDKFRRYCHSIFMCVLYKVDNELFLCYTYLLGTMVDILIQATLMIADTSLNIY